MKTIAEIVSSEKNIAPLLPQAFMGTPPFLFDFSRKNPDLQNVDMMNMDSLQSYIDATLQKDGRTWGMGGYGEDRFFYQSSELFKHGGEYRTFHLGVDIWVPPGTPMYAPLDGTVHSFQDNNHFLDYGPAIILEHTFADNTFYTLYGHLARTSLNGLFEGKAIKQGDTIATVGTMQENGSWAPHLHLQMMTDMLGKKGDFPGTAAPSEKDYYLGLCPDPEILLSRFLKK